MKEYEKYFVLFNDEEDKFTSTLFDEFMNMWWRSKEIFIYEDINNWRRVGFETRSQIVNGLIASHAIKQAIALEFIPILIFSLSDKLISRKSMLSAIQSRLSAQHAAVTSQMIDMLNEVSLKEKSIDYVMGKPELAATFEFIDASFRGMMGWSQILELNQEIEGKNVFNELNKHVWQACALAAMLIETSDSLPVALLTFSMEQHSMPEVLKAVQAMTRDKSIISTYFTKLATSRLNLLPEEEQEIQRLWLENTIVHIFKINWKSIHDNIEYEKGRDEVAVHLLRYNINKILAKLNFPLVYEEVEMPAVVEKYLSVNLDLDGLKIKARKEPWFSWRNKWKD